MIQVHAFIVIILTERQLLAWLIDANRKAGMTEQDISALADDSVLAVLAGR